MDPGQQRGGIKRSLSCPALTAPESKRPMVPAHPHQPIRWLENSTFEQQKRKQLEETPASPGTWYLVSFGSQGSLGSSRTSTALQEHQRWRVRSGNCVMPLLATKARCHL